MERYSELKVAIDTLLKTNSVVRRKKRSESEKKLELFKQIIYSLEEVQTRSYLAGYELSIDLSNYDEKFLEIIDGLLYINYGKDCYDLITFYLLDRINPEDGTINPVIIDETGEEVLLNSPYDLYNLMRRVNPNIE
jgi:hypothetical protein